MFDAHIKKRSPDAFPCRNVQESASFLRFVKGGGITLYCCPVKFLLFLEHEFHE